eukprot:gene6158-6395_t
MTALAGSLPLLGAYQHQELTSIRSLPAPGAYQHQGFYRGPAGAVLLCLSPIMFLILVTLCRQLSLPSTTSLPLAAALLAVIRLAYLSSPPLLVLSTVVKGCLESLTPLSVIFGAIVLFEAMEQTQCLPWMMFHVRRLSAGCALAEVFLIGWSFVYSLSGAGGFNTFILGAPMLVSLSHDPQRAVLVLVMLNTLSSHFSSVGMAIWFGFQSLGLGHQNILLVGLKSAIIVGTCAYIITPLATSYLVPWRELLRSGLFVILSISSAVLPTVLISIFNAEFPVLAGGLIGLALTAFLVYFKFGMSSSAASARLEWHTEQPAPDCDIALSVAGGPDGSLDSSWNGNGSIDDPLSKSSITGSEADCFASSNKDVETASVASPFAAAAAHVATAEGRHVPGGIVSPRSSPAAKLSSRTLGGSC